MPQWGPFITVSAALTALLVFLARVSSRTIEDVDFSDTENPKSFVASKPVPPGAGSERPHAREPSIPDSTKSLRLAHRERTDPVSDLQSRADTPGVSTPSQLGAGVLLANVAVTQLLVVGSILVAAWYFSIPAAAFDVPSEQISAGISGVVVGVGFGIVLWIGNEIAVRLADVAGFAHDETVRTLLAPETTRGWTFLLVGVLPLIAVGEELLFRAALIGVPTAAYSFSPWPLALASAGVFALGHDAQGRVGIVVTGLLGFVLAAGYIFTESLLVVVVAHYVVNTLEFILHESPA